MMCVVVRVMCVIVRVMCVGVRVMCVVACVVRVLVRAMGVALLIITMQAACMCNCNVQMSQLDHCRLIIAMIRLIIAMISCGNQRSTHPCTFFIAPSVRLHVSCNHGCLTVLVGQGHLLRLVESQPSFAAASGQQPPHVARPQGLGCSRSTRTL